MIRLKRAYETPMDEDGSRLLVDRLWPRGVRKADARFQSWEKDVAPTRQLCVWFGHDPEKWPEFQRLYRDELQEHMERLREIAVMALGQTVTLVYAARDREHNEAVVLKEVLDELGKQTATA